MKPQPENTVLKSLLAQFHQNPHDSSIEPKILYELSNGTSFLLLTSANGVKVNEWVTSGEETKIELTCVQEVGGSKVLAAFTDEENLLAWTKQATQYTLMAAQDVLQLCKVNNIDRIVIDTDTPTMFELEKNKQYL